jgi:tRNA A-37 threonylcarbamoyl transferase component Bud32
MRAAGVSHGDLKASNLWYVEGRWIAVDLDAARWHAHWTSRVQTRIARDIRRLLRNWDNDPELRDALAEHIRARRLPVEPVHGTQ